MIRCALLFLLLCLTAPLAVAQQQEPGKPDAGPRVDPALGLTGLWRFHFLENGRRISRYLTLSHNVKKGTLLISDPMFSEGLAFLDSGPFLTKFLNELDWINDELLPIEGNLIRCKRFGLKGEHGNSFTFDLTVRGPNEISGTITCKIRDANWAWKKGVLRILARRAIPRIHSASPRYVSLDDLRGNSTWIHLRGENLHVGLVLHQGYPLNDVRVEGPGVRHIWSRDPEEKDLGRELDILIEAGKDGKTGPVHIWANGVRIDNVFWIVRTNKVLDFIDRRGKPVPVTGFREPVRLRLRFPKDKAPRSPTLTGTVALRDTTHKVIFERVKEGEPVYVSKKPLLVYPPKEPMDPGEALHFRADQNDRIRAAYGEHTADLIVYDECYELKKRIDALTREITDLWVGLFAVRDILARLDEARAPWEEVASRRPLSLPALEKISKVFNNVTQELGWTPTDKLGSLNSYLDLMGDGKSKREQIRKQIAERLQALKEARKQMVALVPDPERKGAGDMLAKAVKAFGALLKAAWPIPESEFPRLPAPPRPGSLDPVVVSFHAVPVHIKKYLAPDWDFRREVTTLLERSKKEKRLAPGKYLSWTDMGFLQIHPDADGQVRSLLQKERDRLYENRKEYAKPYYKMMDACLRALKAAAVLREYDRLLKSADKSGLPEHIEAARTILSFLADLRNRYRAVGRDMVFLQDVKKRERSALLERYVDCLIAHDRDGDLAGAFHRLKIRVDRELERIDRAVEAAEDEMERWAEKMEAHFLALRRRSDEVGRLLAKMQKVREEQLPYEEMMIGAVDTLDKALMIISLARILKGIGKFTARHLFHVGEDLLPPGRIREGLEKGLKKGVKEKHPPEEIAKRINRESMTKTELDDLIGRLNRGEDLEDALKNVYSGRRASKGQVIDTLRDAGMDAVEAEKVYKRLGASGITRKQLEKFAAVVRKNQKNPHAATEEALGHLRSSIEELMDTYGLDLSILSVGSGTDVDKYWMGKIKDIGDFENWKFLKNDWDGAFFFNPATREKQVSRVLEAMRKQHLSELEEIEKGLGHHVSLKELTKRYKALKDGTAAQRAAAEQLLRQKRLIERTVAQRFLEREFRRIFTKRAGYPPSAPDFNLFSDNPVNRLARAQDFEDALRGKVSLLRYVELDPDGVFFTPGGKKYIELMRASDTPVKRTRDGWKFISSAERKALITEGAMSPADGADLVGEMSGFFFHNLAAKYHVPPKALREAAGTLTAEQAKTFTKAANKTAKYYLRAALGRLASDPNIGPKLPDYFGSLHGTPEARIVKIAEDYGRNLFSAEDLQRLKDALEIKRNGLGALGRPVNPADLLNRWTADLNRWRKEAEKASQAYFLRRGKEIRGLKDPARKGAELKALENERALHNYSRDISLARLTPDQLKGYMGMPDADAARLGTVAKNPYVAPYLHPRAGEALRKMMRRADRALGDADPRRDTARLLRNLGSMDPENTAEGWLSAIDMPIEWVEHLQKLKDQGAWGWAKLVTNVAFNVIFSPIEVISRTVLMVYRYTMIDREMHERLASQIGLALHGMSWRLEWHMENDLKATSSLVYYGTGLNLLDVGNLWRDVHEMEKKLEAKAAEDGPRQEQFRLLWKRFLEWKTGTFEPAFARRKNAIQAARGRLDFGLDLFSNLRRPFNAGQQGSKSFALHWAAVLDSIRKYIVDQATYYQGKFLTSSKVLIPLGLLGEMVDSYLEELRRFRTGS